MLNKVIYLLVLIIIFQSSLTYAQHWIAGVVNDAADSTSADGRDVACYYEDDETNNATDEIGENGNSGVANEYMCDAEAIPGHTWQAGDEIFIKVVDSGDEYTAGPVSVVTTGAGWDEAPDMTLQSPNSAPDVPTVIINSTDVSKNYTNNNVTCHAMLVDGDNNSVNVSLRWYNKSVLFLDLTFNLSYPNGTYFNSSLSYVNTSKEQNWSCSVNLNDGVAYAGWANSSNITILNSPPIINVNDSNPDSFVESDNVSIYANVTDDDGDLILWVNFSVAAPNGSVRIDLENATSNIGDWWNSSYFISNAIGTWTWNLTASDGESTTTAFGNYTITSWHIITGNVSGKLTLQDGIGSTLINWDVTDVNGSNIYIADSDSSINFNNLTALGRDMSLNAVEGDFENLDSVLNMTSLDDSVNSTFTFNKNPKNTDSFTSFGKTLSNVPIINSTNSTYFITGILWDSSDDDGGEQYDTADNEDIVFISKVNPEEQGYYGVYDYEIKVPSYLRKYLLGDEVTVSIYAEIR